MLPISFAEVALSSVIVAIAASVQGAVGFGLAMLAAPLLVLIEPDLIPAPLILNGMLLVIMLTYRERKHIDMHGVTWMTLGCIPGSAIAAGVLAVISANGFNILFSILVLLAVVLSALGFSVSLTKPNILMAGVLSGFMGTTSAIGGPPAALIYQNVPAAKLRGTLSAYFCACGIVALIALAFSGRCGTDEMTLALALLPGLLVGLAFSRLTVRILDQYSVRPAVLILSAMSAIAVMIRTLL